MTSGEIYCDQIETIDNDFKYAGEIYDNETGLYYLRARYYDPSVGRFISEDSYEGNITNPLSLNLYTYVQNNPLGYVDPSGHDQKWIRELAKEYGYSVEWEASTKCVVIKKGKEYHRFSAEHRRGTERASCTLKDGKFSVEESIFKCAIGLSAFEVVTGKKPPIPNAAGLRMSESGGVVAGTSVSEDVLYTKGGCQVYGSTELNAGPQLQAGIGWQGIVGWNINSPDDYAGKYEALNLSLKLGGGAIMSVAKGLKPNAQGYYPYVFTIAPTAGWGGGGSYGRGTTYK